MKLNNLSNNSMDCRFCNSLSLDCKTSGVDQILAENDEYFAMSSIGGFVPGWTLIFPKSHKLNLSTDYHNSSFVNFANYVKEAVTSEYGECVVFEHGSNAEGSSTACGVNHAHMHIVPFTKDLVSLAKNESIELIWQKAEISKISELSNGDEYLFCANSWDASETSGFLAILKKPRSQFFRQVLAKSVGLMDFFDYKRYRFEDISNDSANRLSKKLSVTTVD